MALPTHVQRITLDQELIADVERLETEKSDLQAQIRRTDSEGNATAAPAKAGEGAAAAARIAEINAELEALYDRIRNSEGELLLRGVSGGAWMRWKDEHPPREDNVTDKQVAYGLCNALDLLDNLGEYAKEWNGEALTPERWAKMAAEEIAPGDLRDLVTEVVNMHERSGIRIPKSLTVSSSTESSATD